MGLYRKSGWGRLEHDFYFSIGWELGTTNQYLLDKFKPEKSGESGSDRASHAARRIRVVECVGVLFLSV